MSAGRFSSEAFLCADGRFLPLSSRGLSSERVCFLTAAYKDTQHTR